MNCNICRSTMVQMSTTLYECRYCGHNAWLRANVTTRHKSNDKNDFKN